jgi:hypothetical protein
MANEIKLPIYTNRLLMATMLDPDGEPLDLTGAEVVFSVRENHSASAHTLLDGCEAVWTAGNEHIDVSLVTDDVKKGGASILLTVGVDAQAGDLLAHKTISAVDLSGHSSVHVWLKSSVNTAAGDLQFLLDDTAGCESPRKVLDVPALSAGVWKRCVLFFDTDYQSAEVSLPGIISIGIKMAVDKGAFTLAVDDVVAGKYLLEKVLGDNGADPTEGVATFEILAEHTLYISEGSYDYDIEVYYPGTGVRYVPIIAKIELLNHATAKD